jgi:membrane dipeptidase
MDGNWPVVFDGHNDVLLALQSGRDFFARNDSGHIDLPRAREGGLGGGFCAVFVPTVRVEPEEDPEAVAQRYRTAFSDERTMPPTPNTAEAQRVALAMMARLFRLARASDGQMRVIRTVEELEACLQNGGFAALLHMEGAEAIDADMEALEVFYQAGLRSLGPVWSRPNIFGHGVPFRFPDSPDTGLGLTKAGRELIRACNRLRIMIDLSHITEKGFWDVARLSDAPLVATHSNAWSICPSPRNLTDKQLDAIRASGGMVGVNFNVGFLRPDGKAERDTPLDVIADHFVYLVERVGIDGVGFGSDFDGATMSSHLSDVAGLPRVLACLRQRGFDDASLRKLAHENWLRVLKATWAP